MSPFRSNPKTTRRARSESVSSLSSFSDDDECYPVKKRARTTLSASTSTSKARSPKKKASARARPPLLPVGKAKTAGGAGHKKPKKEEEPGPVKDDGKSYLAAGLYYSEPVAPPSKLRKRPSAPLPPPPARGKAGRKSMGDHPPAAEALADEATRRPLLPLPLHFGESLLVQRRDFRLPFDIHRDFDPNAKPTGPSQEAEDEVERRELSRKPARYGHLARNVYHERKADRAEAPVICECVPPQGDEPGMMQYSCSPKLCPCGDKCTNLPLGKLQGIPEGKEGLRVIWTGDRGFGLKTMVPIQAGQFVMEYRGEIISRDESYKRVVGIYKGAKSYYFLDYDGDEVIDAGQRGNSSRFINHSCGPNVKVVRWSLSDVDEYQMGIFAKHDILAGTELSYDYGWQDFSALGGDDADPSRQRCFCGADVCTGLMGAKKKDKVAVAGGAKGPAGNSRKQKDVAGRKDAKKPAAAGGSKSAPPPKRSHHKKKGLPVPAGSTVPKRSHHKKKDPPAPVGLSPTVPKRSHHKKKDPAAGGSTSTAVAVGLVKRKLAVATPRSASKTIGRKPSSARRIGPIAAQVLRVKKKVAATAGLKGLNVGSRDGGHSRAGRTLSIAKGE